MPKAMPMEMGAEQTNSPFEAHFWWEVPYGVHDGGRDETSSPDGSSHRLHDNATETILG